jgi:hypothetical protein
LATVVPRSVAGTSFSIPPKVPIAVLKGMEITISVPLLVKLIVLLLSVALLPSLCFVSLHVSLIALSVTAPTPPFSPYTARGFATVPDEGGFLIAS